MTICALLLARQFFDLQPEHAAEVRHARPAVRQRLDRRHADALRRAAGADGGAPWGWDIAVHARRTSAGAPSLAIAASTAVYFVLFRQRAAAVSRARPPVPDVRTRPTIDADGDRAAARAGVGRRPCTWPSWRGRSFTAHYPGAVPRRLPVLPRASPRRPRPYQSRIELKTPLLVGFFLAGLVIHGGLQGWWIAPVLARLSEEPLFLGATVLTAFNDNALITYLATLVPDLGDSLKLAVVRGRRHRRRPDRHRQRAEPGRPGAAGAVLRRRDPAARPAGRRAPADAHCRGRVPGAVTMIRPNLDLPARRA